MALDRAAFGRGVFVNRTLNLRSIRAIGFDMDYTLVHYRAEVWERRAFEHARQRLAARGWPVEDLTFDPERVTLGLVADIERGNMVKADRFGYVKRACHGTRMLEFEDQRRAYSRVRVDLQEPRWAFLNTLFSISEGNLYLQLVDRLDEGRIPEVIGYDELYAIVRASIDEVHLEGALKAEIATDPGGYVSLDEELVSVLLDLKHAGKKLLLITNSDWTYTRAMLGFALDRYLPGTGWQDLFDLVFLSARKPAFFTQENAAFEVLDQEGRLLPAREPLVAGRHYVGGDAVKVERALGIPGEEILYVGDHLYADVHVSKRLLRWRTALVLRELEEEVAATATFEPKRRELERLMAEKVVHERTHARLRLEIQRKEAGYGEATRPADVVRTEMLAARSEISSLDDRIAPLAKEGSELHNRRWGPLMRAGNDKSHLARQVERYADIYFSRVSNLLYETPFGYLRAPRGVLPHEEPPPGFLPEPTEPG